MVVNLQRSVRALEQEGGLSSTAGRGHRDPRDSGDREIGNIQEPEEEGRRRGADVGGLFWKDREVGDVQENEERSSLGVEGGFLFW